ncbi:hypothetical protein B0H21DRAFT_566805 [Amylocystis lapponica]|nr:hypothetical protein B0H21DRAFT_566805 [Amylocystis lapponica]
MVVPEGKWACEPCGRLVNNNKKVIERHLDTVTHANNIPEAERRPRAPLICRGCGYIVLSGRPDSLLRHRRQNCRPRLAVQEPRDEMPVARSPVRLPSPPVAGPSGHFSPPPVAGPSQRLPSPPAVVRDHVWPVFALEREVAPPPQVFQEPVVFPPPVYVAERVQGPDFDIPAPPAGDPFALPEYDAEGAFTRHLLGEDGWDFGGW